MTAHAAPVDTALPELLDHLAAGRNVVLEAPPGAGKTTRTPLALLDAAWTRDQRILMLEPRRVAARAAAARMAETLGEPVGRRVGYRIRDEAKIGRETRIEVLTEGILTRRLQRDPSLDGVAVVLFDEIHERSLNADLGLALCLESQAALRSDLRLVAMSATLDARGIADAMGAAIVRAEGRSFPVEVVFADRPAPPFAERPERFADAVAARCRDALDTAPDGDVLAFLPGAREIRAAARALDDLRVDVAKLMGEGSAAEQAQALAPSPPGRRKVVLATAVAETSLTLPGVTVVVDGGRARLARFDPASGMGRLITTRVSKAGAGQRAGRAGRVRSGTCLRLWTKGEHGALAERDPPEILDADLAGLALELADWGAAPGDLPFLDQPPEAAFAQAQALLRALGALDAQGRITDHGRALAAAPLHPRLAHMALRAGADRDALRLAALLSARDPLASRSSALRDRIEALRAPGRAGAAEPALRRIAADADRLAKRLVADAAAPSSLGVRVASAFPDRIAARRPGASDGWARFLLSGGKGARLRVDDPLADEPFLAVAELSFDDGASADARIRLAAPIDAAEIEAVAGDALIEEDIVVWEARDRRVRATRRRRFGAIALAEAPLASPDPTEVAQALADGVRDLGLDGLDWSEAARRLRRRIAFAREAGADLPAVDDDTLLADPLGWLGARLLGGRTAQDLKRIDVASALRDRLDWTARTELDRIAPEWFETPLGGRRPIDYADDGPRVEIRLQELFGVAEHPRAAGRPIALTLLSPAGRPIQITADLPGFWSGAYADVAKEMRGRYPKHPWPDDPAAAAPTRRAKPRGGSNAPKSESTKPRR